MVRRLWRGVLVCSAYRHARPCCRYDLPLLPRTLHISPAPCALPSPSPCLRPSPALPSLLRRLEMVIAESGGRREGAHLAADENHPDGVYFTAHRHVL